MVYPISPPPPTRLVKRKRHLRLQTSAIGHEYKRSLYEVRLFEPLQVPNRGTNDDECHRQNHDANAVEYGCRHLVGSLPRPP